MWIEHLENPEALHVIYGSDLPQLNSIECIEMKIGFGEDIDCSIKFDIRRLPKVPPKK